MGTLDKIKKLLSMKEKTKMYSVRMYAEMKLDDGRLLATEDEQFMIGSKVFVVSDDGEATPLESGSYTMDDGAKMTVDDESRILDLGEEKEAEDVEQPEEASKEEVEMNEETTDKATEETPTETPEQELSEEVKGKEEVPIEMSAELVSELITRLEGLENKIVELSKEPAEEGIKYNPEGSNSNSTVDLTKMSNQDRAAYYINNLK